jgi:hypothetical protein
MAEKIDFRDVKKGDFGTQMELRKKSIEIMDEFSANG